MIPPGVLILTAAVDVHKDRLEVLWDGWGQREECWVIEHVILRGEVEDDSVWTQLGQELNRKFPHALGIQLALHFGLIDGGKWPDRVLRFLSRLAGNKAFEGDPLPGLPIRGKIKACRGYGGPLPKGGRHPIHSAYTKHLAKNLGGFWVGTDAAKDLIYTRARLAPEKQPDRTSRAPDGFIHFPTSLDEEFFRQLFSEHCITKFEHGQEIRTYTKKGSVRNEALDLFVYNLAAFKLCRLNQPRLANIEAELKREAAELKKPVRPESLRPDIVKQPRRPRKSGWMNWRN